MALVRRSMAEWIRCDGDGDEHTYGTHECGVCWCPHAYSRRATAIFGYRKEIYDFLIYLPVRCEVVCVCASCCEHTFSSAPIYDYADCKYALGLNASIQSFGWCARLDHFRFVEFYTYFCHFGFMFTTATTQWPFTSEQSCHTQWTPNKCKTHFATESRIFPLYMHAYAFDRWTPSHRWHVNYNAITRLSLHRMPHFCVGICGTNIGSRIDCVF